MSGLSDVRVQLLAKELEEGGRTKVYNPSTGLSHWGLMLHRWRTRKALLELDARQLRDIGLTWEQAREEGCKPFWRE
ncbi:DUF1127 domain-containing protein [Pseudomonas entomophila]|uniref:DUF1127 domain-containing protein n=1 Tax=Pseudomonas entomophila TaxID=312306 RepID=UPI00200FB9F9|nr:DUF1127 domain-containing protein [Pseudomonas entomophila]